MNIINTRSEGMKSKYRILEWILIDDFLPMNSGKYLASIQCMEGAIYTEAVEWNELKNRFERRRRAHGYGGGDSGEIIAWMEYPTPLRCVGF